MFAEIREHVEESVADLTGRREGLHVVTVAPDAALVPRHAVDGASEADREAAHAAGERLVVRSLDDEVDVIVLDGEVDDAEERPRGEANGPLDRAEDAAASQRPHVPHRPQRGVEGFPSTELGALAVGKRRPYPRRALAPGVLALAAPGGQVERKLGRSARHLETAIN